MLLPPGPESLWILLVINKPAIASNSDAEELRAPALDVMSVKC